MKKLIALLLVFVMVLTMVACAAKTNAPKADMPANDTKTDMPATEESKTEAPAGKIKVGFVTQSLTNASQAYAWTQFQKYAPEYGFEVTLFDEDYDSQNGVAAISTCIAEGYTAICLNPTDPAALVPALKEAKEAGIIIGLYSSDLPDESKQYRNFMCGTNDFLFGEIAAQTMMAAFPNGVKMVEVGGQSGHDAQIKRHDGFMSAIDDSVTVLDSKDVAQWATEDAMAIMEDFISLYGDEIQAVFCHWDTGATGVIQALKNAGIEGVYVIGIDGSYFRVQNKAGSITGYMPKSCLGTQKVKTNQSTPKSSTSTDWKSKVVALKWYDGGSSVLKKGEYGAIYDIATGISFKVYRMGGSSHADIEPATREDTEKLKKIVGGEYSWDSRAVILNAGGYYVACAINTMPHGDQTITSNGYEGQFCLHMLDSKTHGSDSVNSEHQKAIRMAYNWAH